MKIIVTFGPVIGAAIMAVYVLVLRIYVYVKELLFCTACHWRKLSSGWNGTGRGDRQHEECLSDCLQGV